MGDPPTDARKFTHEIKNKDIVVIGSDGFFLIQINLVIFFMKDYLIILMKCKLNKY